MSRILRPLVAAVVALFLCLTPAARAADETTVKAKDNFFTPVYKVITVGDSVVWVNDGADRHTVTSYDSAPESFDSSDETEDTCDDGNPLTTEDCLEPGEQFGPIEFTTLGTYRYRCKVHGGDGTVKPDRDARAQEQPCGMCGIIKVVAEKQDTSGPRRSTKPSPQTVTQKSKSPSPSPSPSESLDVRGSPLAVGTQDDGDGLRLLLALLSLGGLGGAGWWTWRKYLA